MNSHLIHLFIAILVFPEKPSHAKNKIVLSRILPDLENFLKKRKKDLIVSRCGRWILLHLFNIIVNIRIKCLWVKCCAKFISIGGSEGSISSRMNCPRQLLHYICISEVICPQFSHRVCSHSLLH